MSLKIFNFKEFKIQQTKKTLSPGFFLFEGSVGMDEGSITVIKIAEKNWIPIELFLLSRITHFDIFYI